MKCEIPSYVSDFIVVDMWVDSDGGSYYPNSDQYGTKKKPILEIARAAHKCSHLSHELDFFHFNFSFSIRVDSIFLSHSIWFPVAML